MYIKFKANNYPFFNFVICRPKWFPLRKHSQNKNEKSPAEKTLTKKSSEKSLRVSKKLFVL